MSHRRANLFAQFAVAITYPIPVTFYRGTGVRLWNKGVPVVPSPDDAIQ